MIRALAILLILTFAAGTVVHAAQASDMAVKMSIAEATDGAMPDCDGCGGDDEDTGNLFCSPACVAPAVAILGGDAIIVGQAAAVAVVSSQGQVAGRPALVDPHPPRSNVLI